MNTEQNYVGRGNYATSTEQTANNARQTGQNQAETKATYQPLNPTTELLNTVSSFFNDQQVCTVIETINNVTHGWLTRLPDCDDSHNRIMYTRSHVVDVMFTMNKLTEFLVNLQQWDNRIAQSNGRLLP